MSNPPDPWIEILNEYAASSFLSPVTTPDPTPAESAISAFKALALREALEIVGEIEIEYSNLDGNAGYWEKHGRNQFRTQLRAKFKDHYGGGDA